MVKYPWPSSRMISGRVIAMIASPPFVIGWQCSHSSAVLMNTLPPHDQSTPATVRELNHNWSLRASLSEYDDDHPGARRTPATAVAAVCSPPTTPCSLCLIPSSANLSLHLSRPRCSPSSLNEGNIYLRDIKALDDHIMEQ